MTRRLGRKPASTFGSRTDVGCVREHNEDSLVVAPPLYVVCDGMGGHAAGEVASEIAVNVIADRAPATPDAAALGQAVEEANLAIIQAAREGVGRAGMGCTCTAAMLENERLIVAQVGDSRAYLLHGGTLQQITPRPQPHGRLHRSRADHARRSARVHPQRSVITRALGSDPRTQPDLFEINVNTGDRLLICSDGLTSMIEDYEIEDILNRTPDPQIAASKLVNAAIAAGGHDNVTVIVVNVTGFAEVRRRKVARKTKITAAVIIALLVAIFSRRRLRVQLLDDADRLPRRAGRQGRRVPRRSGELFDATFSQIVEVTDVSVDDLQPGVANRLKTEGVRADSVEEAKDLVDTYREEIAARDKSTSSSSSAGSAASNAGSSSASSSNASSSSSTSGVSA